jgi:hypothetical protein
MEAYQEAFWRRQLARVEEQVTLPAEHMAAVAAAREQSTNGMHAEDDVSSIVDGDGNQSMSESEIAATAKALMELFKPQAGQLPLARIKKVMKASDDDVKVSDSKRESGTRTDQPYLRCR